MERLKDWDPSSCDSKSNYMGDRSHFHWYVFPLCKTRDSDLLTESNWECITKELQADKVPGCEIHRFGHWACGYYEIILIHPWHKSLLDKAYDIERALYNYPVFSDDHYSQLQWDNQAEQWESWVRRDFTCEIENTYDVDLIDVPDSELWCYFDYCADKANTYWEDEGSSGMYISVTHVAEKVTLEDMILKLPDIKVSTELLTELPHSFYHLMAQHGIKVKTLDDTLFEVPDFIAVQYDKRAQCLTLRDVIKAYIRDNKDVPLE